MDKWNTYKNALRDLLTKPDGTVDMEDGTGAIVTLPTMPALQKTVNDMLDAGSGAVANAQNSASAAQMSASASATSAANADASAKDADTSAQAAASSATNSSQSAAESASSATEAAGYRNQAAASATSADSSRTRAADSAAGSAGSANAAGASADAAASSATDAKSYADEAHSWALTAQTTVTGLLHYKGAFDASTGSFPASPSTGDFWKISASGVIDGTELSVGDQIIYSGSGWDKIDNTESVTSVAGRIGAVVLASSDITDLEDKLNAKASTTNPTISGSARFTTADDDWSVLSLSADGSAQRGGLWVDSTGVSLVNAAGGQRNSLSISNDGVLSFSGTSGMQVNGVRSTNGLTAASADGTVSVTYGYNGDMSANGGPYYTIWNAGNFDPSTKQPTESVVMDDISARTPSGPWQSQTHTAGWPAGADGWWHLHATTHSNLTNYFSMQFACAFNDPNLLSFRVTNGDGNAGWSRVLHSGNFQRTAASSLYAPNGTDANSLQGLLTTVLSVGASPNRPEDYCTIANFPGGGGRDGQLAWYYGGAGQPPHAHFRAWGDGGGWQSWANVTMGVGGAGRIFVQGGDPGGNAYDGDLWIW